MITEEENHKAKYGKIGERPQPSAEEMDVQRQKNIAYEYLCHLEEAKMWIEACIEESLPEVTEMEEVLRNGVILAKLAHFMSNETVPLRRIYDSDMSRYESRGLHFKHTDNINLFLKALNQVGFPSIFYPETTDIYDRKNIPRCIYCIHALSLYLFKLGKAPLIQDLYGKLTFTDEQINAMRKELAKYGIQMPAFGKIGGILANQLPVDEAALHAAVIAINEAIEQSIPEQTIKALHNPAAHLDHVDDDCAEIYQLVLYDAKHMKSEGAKNRSLDPDYVADVYDELLTQAEIQGLVQQSNGQRALSYVRSSVGREDKDALLAALRNRCLSLKDVLSDNTSEYLRSLSSIVDNEDFDRDSIQKVLVLVNNESCRMAKLETFVAQLNTSLINEDVTMLEKSFSNALLFLPKIYLEASALYLQELSSARQEKNADLEFDEIFGGLQVLSAVAQVNKSIESKNVDELYGSLMAEDVHIVGVAADCVNDYLKELRSRKNGKYLSHSDIQQAVNSVNKRIFSEAKRIEAVHRINNAIDAGVVAGTLSALQNPHIQLEDVDSKQAFHYQRLLACAKLGKAKTLGEESAELWYEEIARTIDLANSHANEVIKMSAAISVANVAIDERDEDTLIKSLSNPVLCLKTIPETCITTCLEALEIERKDNVRKATVGEIGSGWTMNRTRDGNFKFFSNVYTGEYLWERRKDMLKDKAILTRDQISKCIEHVLSQHDRYAMFKANVSSVIAIQSIFRRYQARKRYVELRAAIKIQSWWRAIRERRKFMQRLESFHFAKHETILIQSMIRRFIARRKYTAKLDYYKQHESAAVKIQAFVRAHWMRNDYRTLMNSNKPPLAVVRKFVHLLEQSHVDYAEEIELQRLRQQLVSDIRTNQALEADLDQMDVKIGLLIRNRTSLQDVIKHHKSLKRYTQENQAKGIKSLHKTSRDRLEAYQHLFYLLQTQPSYLARLVFELPPTTSSKLLESSVLTLFNYGSNPREEYLLLKLYESALKEEIRSKIGVMSDIISGNPLVIKMIVSLNREAKGQEALRNLLQPLVTSIVDSNDLDINTNPCDIYKSWINENESATGKPSPLPYEVDSITALQYDYVRDKISENVNALQVITDKVLNAILASPHQLPYAMRYMAKVLRHALHERFPEALEKDVLKVLGNLVYYRYINSAIVAPDAFNIIQVPASSGLKPTQRKNLGSVAKMLQFIASNKGFGGEHSAHLTPLNSYIMQAHVRFKQYLVDVCDVESLENYYNIDEWTDVTLLSKPIIYISIQEMIDIHKLLMQHESHITDGADDPLHEILEELGDIPTPEEVAGHDEESRSVGRTEISLTLCKKNVDLLMDDTISDARTLFLRTKRLTVDVLRCQNYGSSLLQVLLSPTTSEEEKLYQVVIARRQRLDRDAERRGASLVRHKSTLTDARLPLEVIKTKIINNLRELEKQQLVSEADDFQAMVTSIANDIRSQRVHRARRRNELTRVRMTIDRLAAKRAFSEEQVNFYTQYIKTCLDKQQAVPRKQRKLLKTKKNQSIKYSAAKLREKGVVLEIEGLPHNQFKNVQFEIKAADQPGVFDISAKFMGVDMDKVQLTIDDLLQQQYEGVAKMNMFDKAYINVNLLIFLLNKKFYGK